MTGFDYQSARAARVRNPLLTEYDTGEILQPHIDPGQRGWVDFDNDESATVVRVQVTPSSADDGAAVLCVDTLIADRIDVVNGAGDVIWWGETAGATVTADTATPEEVRVSVASSEWDQTESTYVDIEGLTAIMNAWAANDVRRTWAQEGEESSAVLVLSYWDVSKSRQVVDVTYYDPDAERAIGLGWSLTGLPFSVDVTGPALESSGDQPKE